MDGKSSCGFRISAGEVDFITPPEEVSSSRDSTISCLPNSAPAADPASLQKTFSESIANNNSPQLCEREDFNRISTEINIPMEIADNNNSQYSTGATVIYSPPTGNSFAAASPANVEGRSSGIIGFNSRPNRGSADSRLSADSTTPKVGKKRSRASRRAPTTVLTTDTSNFRAMVQEFTGIPISPFSSAPFPRHGIDFLGGPQAAGLPSFLQRPFPYRTPMPPINNYGPFPPLPNSTPPPTSYFMQSVMQTQRPPKDWIPLPLPLPASNTLNNVEEVGLNVVLPDLVSSDGRPHARTPDGSTRKNTMNKNIKVGAGGGRAFDRRSSSFSFSSEESGGRNPPRPDRGTIDSWIDSSLHIHSPDKDNAAQ